jgi:uncharacterized protein (DUF2062 family)
MPLWKKQQNRLTPTGLGQRLSTATRTAYGRFLKIRGTPREIALGLALGLFVGMTPFMGVQMAIAAFFAALFKWNKISAAAGVWISNPLSAPFIYGLTYITGAWVMGIHPHMAAMPPDFGFSSLVIMLKQTPEILTRLIVGGIVIGIPLAVIGYYVAFSAVQKYQTEVREKRHSKEGKTPQRPSPGNPEKG